MGLYRCKRAHPTERALVMPAERVFPLIGSQENSEAGQLSVWRQNSLLRVVLSV